MLDVAYTLMVEERVSAHTPPILAMQQVDDVLDPDAKARREDQQAMERLSATRGMPTVGRRG